MSAIRAPSSVQRQRSRKKFKAGQAARARALYLIEHVLNDGQPLEYLLDREHDDGLSAQDRALARAIAATTLRRFGEIDHILSKLMSKSLGKRGGPAIHILRMTIAQIVFMNVPDHASVSTAVDLAKADHKARHFSKLINGILRTLIRERTEIETLTHARENLPHWLSRRWKKAYGAATRDAIAEALANEPYLDLAVKPDAKAVLVETLMESHEVLELPTGTIRLSGAGRVTDLPGFEEGSWWVQDMAASLAPAVLGDVAGLRVVDLCAAPGGKTAYLASRGADVTAVDHSEERLKKLQENLRRLKLDMRCVTADVVTWAPAEPFDAILLDAPCSATGTARKHPDILHLKSESQIEKLSKLQREMLAAAARQLKTGGRLVFCTCSLEPEEGEEALAYVEETGLPLALDPIKPEEIGGLGHLLRPEGTIRTLPSHMPLNTTNAPGNEPSPTLSGLDGFFIARFRKTER